MTLSLVSVCVYMCVSVCVCVLMWASSTDLYRRWLLQTMHVRSKKNIKKSNFSILILNNLAAWGSIDLGLVFKCCP